MTTHPTKKLGFFTYVNQRSRGIRARTERSSHFPRKATGFGDLTALTRRRRRNTPPPPQKPKQGPWPQPRSILQAAPPPEKNTITPSPPGVKTVIDLQQDGENREQGLVESAGMKFFRIGLSDSSWPSPEKAAQFLKIVNDPANQPVFIHCHGGRHRAGVMTAIYRMTHDGWNADRAYTEMKQYDFESGIGHSGLKDYVYDYYSRNSQKGIAVKTDK